MLVATDEIGGKKMYVNHNPEGVEQITPSLTASLLSYDLQ